MQITTRTALKVAHHEGVVRQVYRDSVGGDEQAKINAILAAMHAHGLIAT